MTDTEEIIPNGHAEEIKELSEIPSEILELIDSFVGVLVKRPSELDPDNITPEKITFTKLDNDFYLEKREWAGRQETFTWRPDNVGRGTTKARRLISNQINYLYHVEVPNDGSHGFIQTIFCKHSAEGVITALYFIIGVGQTRIEYDFTKA